MAETKEKLKTAAPPILLHSPGKKLPPRLRSTSVYSSWSIVQIMLICYC